MNKNTSKILVTLTVLVIVICAIYFLNKKEVAVVPTPITSNVSKVTEKKIEDKNEFYDISAIYPVDARDKDIAVEKFVTYKVNEKKEDWKIGGEAYIEEKKIEKDFPDRPKMQYQYSVTYKKYESTRWNTVSYVFTTYEYTGGANGNITINTFTFNDKGVMNIDSILDFSNYKDIALTKALADEIIKEGGDQASPDMVLDGLGFSYLKEDGKTIDKSKCQCDGFFFPSNFQNFVVEDGGLRFFFNKYQIAPGSAGTPEIILPWKFLSPYLQGDFAGL